MLSAANTPSYVKTYLTTMVQTHTMDIQDNQQTLATTTNPTLVQFAQDDLPTDWMHRAAAQLLLGQAAAMGAAQAEAPAAMSQGDVKMLQQIATTNNLQRFLTQLDLLADPSPAKAKPDAEIVLTDARDLDLALNDLASSEGTVVPSDVSGVEEVAARSVVAALGSKNFQSVYLADLNAAETWLSRELAGAQAGAQDARLKALTGQALGTVRADLKAVQGLISRGRGRDRRPGRPRQLAPQHHPRRHRPADRRDVLLRQRHGVLPRAAHRPADRRQQRR